MAAQQTPSIINEYFSHDQMFFLNFAYGYCDNPQSIQACGLHANVPQLLGEQALPAKTRSL